MPFSPKTNYTYLLFDQNFILLCKYNIPELKNLCLIASSINNCCGTKKVFISLQEKIFAVFLINNAAL